MNKKERVNTMNKKERVNTMNKNQNKKRAIEIAIAGTRTITRTRLKL